VGLEKQQLCSTLFAQQATAWHPEELTSCLEEAMDFLSSWSCLL